MKLFYREYGSGPPFIILHGLFGLSDNWVTMARRIAEKFTVYIPDQRNHGQSPQSHAFSYEAMVDDLDEFLYERKIAKAILLGHSMGGKVAMRFALDFPANVEKLIVVDISPKPYSLDHIHLDILKVMTSVDFNLVHTRNAVADIIADKIKDERIRLFILKNLYHQNKDRLAWRVNLEAINNNLDDIAEGLYSEKQYPGPVLFIRGGLSNYIIDADIPAILRFFPAAVIESIAGATHWVHADQPQKMCEVLSRFIGKACDL